MQVWADHKKYYICNYVMVLATLGFCIVQLAGNWIEYENGTVSLWQDCWRLENTTDCNGTPQMECNSTAMTGPAWLEICRTFACFHILFYVLIWYMLERSKLSNRNTFLGQVRARSPIIIYFTIGLLMLSTAILYHINYKGFYEEDEKKKQVRPSFGLLVAYIGGGITTLNSIFLSSKVDTGFTAYVKSRFSCLKSNNGNTRASRGTDVEVRARFSALASAVKRCGHRLKRKENGDSTNNNDNNTTGTLQVTTVNGSTQTTDEASSELVVVNVVPLNPNQNATGGRDRSQETGGRDQSQDEDQTHVFAPSPNRLPIASRSGSVASVSQLALDVRSLSGANENYDTVIKSPPSYSASTLPTQQDATSGQGSAGQNQRSSNSPTVLSYIYCSDDTDAAPPSYEDVMRYDSNC